MSAGNHSAATSSSGDRSGMSGRIHVCGVISLEAGDEGAVIGQVSGAEQRNCFYPPHWRGLLFVDGTLEVLEGSAFYYEGDVTVMSKFLAFWDEINGISVTAASGSVVQKMVSVAVEEDVLGERKTAELWMLRALSGEKSEALAALSFLRRIESYSLVRYLLMCSAEHRTLVALAQCYGLSYSHFRRLCHRALGTSAKADLRKWRMVHSLFDVIDRKGTLTSIAIRRGYASSAHFSNDVRMLIGISPGEIFNILSK